MSWRVAKSLDRLLEQINQQAPNRSKSSDGGVGDAAHASRTSDHNPWVQDAQGLGVVTARDFTHDPADGCDCQALVDALVRSRDPRIKYVIWDRQILSSSNWQWKPYTGSNPHTLHAHVSVKADPQFYDDGRAWNITLPPANPSAPRRVPRPVLRKGDTGESVRILQKAIGNLTVDGIFGQDTLVAVKMIQEMNGLVPDGIVGAYTWQVLFPGHV